MTSIRARLTLTRTTVFLTFWQASALAVFAMAGVIKDVSASTSSIISVFTACSQTEYMSAADINIGIGAILETFEMMCAFSSS